MLGNSSLAWQGRRRIDFKPFLSPRRDVTHGRLEVAPAALRTAIRDTALDAFADRAGVTVSKSDIDAAVACVGQAIGGYTSLDGQLTAQGLTRDDFRTLTRYRLLESRLR